MRIAHCTFLTLLPLGSAINRVPFISFKIKVVVRTLGVSRSLIVLQVICKPFFAFSNYT